ncbi:hypothetical protein BaRGS_00002422 [Batillaria attramentaria]|uniref:Uncharacterized protein n=1 Tax=Batillaria attramentaria TaxID=370345 RepID=A0ABD0M496_9CAEN
MSLGFRGTDMGWWSTSSVNAAWQGGTFSQWTRSTVAIVAAAERTCSKERRRIRFILVSDHTLSVTVSPSCHVEGEENVALFSHTHKTRQLEGSGKKKEFLAWSGWMEVISAKLVVRVHFVFAGEQLANDIGKSQDLTIDARTHSPKMRDATSTFNAAF